MASPSSTRDPLVSVVIPTRDRPTLLAQAVESALDQTETSLEVVVIDDGSNPAISLDRLPADGRVRLVRTDGLGSAAARNLGMGLIRGSYVAFLDDDDRWTRSKTEEQLRLLDTTGGAWSACGYRLWDGDELVDTFHPPPEAEFLEAMYTNCEVQTSTVLMRTELAHSLGPMREDLLRTEDWLWFLAAAERELPIVSSRVLVDRNVNQTPPDEQGYWHARFLEEIEPRLQTLPTATASRIRRRHEFNLAIYAAKAGSQQEARRRLLALWLSHPQEFRPLIHTGRTIFGERGWTRLKRLRA